MKNIYFILFYSFLFTSCIDDKIYNKQVNNNEIYVNWYHYSYITSSSPNYITVKKNEEEIVIFRTVRGLQDVELRGDTIFISHLKFQVKPEIQRNRVFEYFVKYKEVNSHDMYLKYLEDEKVLDNTK